jgi:hypothetical protein
MENETARQAYIRLLRGRVEATDSLTSEQREVVLFSELINDDCLNGDVGENGSGFPVRATVFGIKPKGRLLLQQLEEEEFHEFLVQKHREAFKSLDRRKISAMDDKSLAEWQSDFKQDEPEWRIAEYEWQRRLTVEQIKAVRWAAIIGICAIIIGALLAKILERL